MEENKTNTPIDNEELTKKMDRSCNDLIEKLNEEKQRLENELRQEYRKARKYVRAHPEEGLAWSFLGGIVVGIVLTKIFSR